jgi:TatA/E family protein of Tat protein translocase
MEIIVVLVIALFLFGDKLPGVMRWLGQSAAEFRKEANNITEGFNNPTAQATGYRPQQKDPNTDQTR